ncbi:MAG TPA: glycosyltransferase, partial [Hyphomicrobiaceae bacterium]|nr:glycosyltransferase [Hyphomicrobiaceae bacterium]
RSALPSTAVRPLVVPSRAESFPYVVLEAAAAALPLIATRVGGIPEIVTDQSLGLLIGAGDADALADAMEIVLSDPGSASARADALRRSVGRRFTAAEMARNVTEFYGVAPSNLQRDAA